MDYEIGQSVADMHYGQPSKDFQGNPIEITQFIKLRLDGSDAIVKFILAQIGKRHHDNPYWADNKIAKVIGVANDGDSWQAAYTYDDRWFGLFEFKEVTP